MRLPAIDLISLALSAFLLSASVNAQAVPAAKPHAPAPEGWDLNKTPYIGKGPVNTRSPCPMLNTLANHGILPYSGRDITRDELTKALISIGANPLSAVQIAASAFKDFSRKSESGVVLDLVDLQA